MVVSFKTVSIIFTLLQVAITAAGVATESLNSRRVSSKFLEFGLQLPA